MPDGRYVASRLARRRSGRDSDDSIVDVWIIPVDGGEASKLTDHKSKITAFEWTRDSASIVFLAERVKPESQKSAEKAGDDAIFVDEGSNGQERAEYSELWRVGVANRREQAVTHDNALLIESFRVAPDGRKIAMIFRRENTRNGQNRAEVAVVDMATGAFREVTHNNAPEQNVQWSPEGKVLSYLAPSDTSWIWPKTSCGSCRPRAEANRAGSAHRTMAPSESTPGPPMASRSCSARTRARAVASSGCRWPTVR